ncbi:MAG: putative toxin-antitoxin system toxin component, PIN family [Geminicoccaceae bacterium]|nr:putative toxin-antitoxin system toxin component, PIN family [Geminicoccaceae bacterium]
MPRSAVVDASVLVSAFLFPESVPGRVVALAGRGAYALHLSPILIEEVRRSLLNPRLRNRYGQTEDSVRAWYDELTAVARMVDDLPDIAPVCRDPDDDHVVAAALVAGADCIVTGDRDLLALGRHESVRIVTARAFLDELAG